jgi:hypothetical protein
MYLPHRYSLWFVMLTLGTWCAMGSSASAQGALAATQSAAATCPQDDSGLKLPAGFCATIFADGIGHARHLVVAPNGGRLRQHLLWGDGSFASIANTITNGVPQPKQYRSPMPPMGGAQLTSDQVSALAAYIWALSHRP